jgi:glycosyltransferase involved in cell wall biosynthesis
VEAYEGLAARHGRRVVCVSERVAAQWTEHYRLAANRTRVVHNGVDTTVFHPGSGAEAAFAGPALRVLFVGRLEEAKGMAVLERLHHELLADGDRAGISVELCSPTPPPPAMVARFPGFEIRSGLDGPTLAEAYRRADLFFLPSRYEAFELSSLEALACGTPVLLHDTGTRPTLHRLGCPGVEDLAPGESPLGAIRRAATRLRGLRRRELAAWTVARFDASAVSGALAEVFREMGLA